MSIRYEHIALEDVPDLNLRSYNQVYVIDLNKTYLTILDQAIDNRLPKEEIVEFLPLGQSVQKIQPMISRFDMIVNLILQQQLIKNPILRQLHIFGIKGKSLIQLYSTPNFQKDNTTFQQIKQLIVDNITLEKGDVGSALLSYLQSLLAIIRSGAADRSIGSCLEVFLFMNGSEIPSEIENKCVDELAKLKLSTDKVSISYRVSDFFTSQVNFLQIASINHVFFSYLITSFDKVDSYIKQFISASPII